MSADVGPAEIGRVDRSQQDSRLWDVLQELVNDRAGPSSVAPPPTGWADAAPRRRPASAARRKDRRGTYLRPVQ